MTLSLLRIVIGFLFIPHGAQKLFGALGSEPAELLSLRGMAGVLEVFGGLLILAGLYTRPVAFILSGQMAVAYFLRHAPDGFWPILNGGELAAFYCFAYLFLSTTGGGPWSLDAWLRSKRSAST
jgi:putative oxidoreductase